MNFPVMDKEPAVDHFCFEILIFCNLYTKKI